MNGQQADTDEDLMAAASTGEAAAVDVLYRRYADDLKRYLQRFESDNASAEDLVQETFVRLIRYGASFDPAGSFRGWLFRIARNVGLAAVSSRAGREELDDVVLTAADDPEREYRMREAMAALIGALGELSEGDRQVLVLARIEGRSYREIGRITGATEGAVKVRVFRALQRLRHQLQD